MEPFSGNFKIFTFTYTYVHAYSAMCTNLQTKHGADEVQWLLATCQHNSINFVFNLVRVLLQLYTEMQKRRHC